MTDLSPWQATGPEQVRVGPYELLTKLGEGGMGVVHLARHEETGERVALKVLRTNVVGDEETRARLEREVRLLGQVRSPWIAEIVDADPFTETPYVATRYVPGPTLHDRVKVDGPILGEERFWLARCLADGIAACHEAGVLHRDVKPANVVMEGATPVLIDFGIARVADDPKITLTGWLIGTPGYLAPEIIEGEVATEASDVHSWAATTAYALLGRPPFGTGPSMAILDRVRRGQHDLRGIEGSMREVLAAALATRPETRPGLEELREWLMEPEQPWVSSGATELLPAPTLVDPDAARSDAEVTALLGLVSADPTFEEVPATAVTVVQAPEESSEPVVVRKFDPAEVSHPDAPPPEPAPTRWGRPSAHSALRRWPGPRHFLVLVALAAITAGVVAAYPMVGVAAACLSVWLLRGVSKSAEHLAKRRETRGRKWYDAFLSLVRSPWDVLRALPGAVAVSFLAGVIAGAVGLGCALLGASLTGQLLAGAMAFSGAVWLGSQRIRDTVSPVIRAASSPPPRWLVAFVALVIVAAAIAIYAGQAGVEWWPRDDLPDDVSNFLKR